MLSYELRCSGNPGVSHGRWIVILADKVPPSSWVSGDYLTIVFPPFSLDFDKVMSVYPRFEGSFVLGWKCRKGSDEKVFGEDNDVFVIVISLIIVRSSR